MVQFDGLVAVLVSTNVKGDQGTNFDEPFAFFTKRRIGRAFHHVKDTASYRREVENFSIKFLGLLLSVGRFIA